MIDLLRATKIPPKQQERIGHRQRIIRKLKIAMKRNTDDPGFLESASAMIDQKESEIDAIILSEEAAILSDGQALPK